MALFGVAPRGGVGKKSGVANNDTIEWRRHIWAKSRDEEGRNSGRSSVRRSSVNEQAAWRRRSRCTVAVHLKCSVFYLSHTRVNIIELSVCSIFLYTTSFTLQFHEIFLKTDFGGFFLIWNSIWLAEILVNVIWHMYWRVDDFLFFIGHVTGKGNKILNAYLFLLVNQLYTFEIMFLHKRKTLRV